MFMIRLVVMAVCLTACWLGPVAYFIITHLPLWMTSLQWNFSSAVNKILKGLAKWTTLSWAHLIDLLIGKSDTKITHLNRWNSHPHISPHNSGKCWANPPNFTYRKTAQILPITLKFAQGIRPGNVYILKLGNILVFRSITHPAPMG